MVSGLRSTTKRPPKIAAPRTTETDALEFLWIDSDAPPKQDSGSSANTAALVLPPMAGTGMTGNSVKELRNTYEARAHNQGSSRIAHANAELKPNRRSWNASINLTPR